LPALLSLGLVFVVMMPLTQLLSAEWRAPDRLRIAPCGSAYRLRLVAAAGVGELALVVLATLAIGWGRWGWVLMVIGAAT
jgi:hypothetical protein